MTKGRRRIDAARLADRAGRAANGFAPPAARTRGASPGKGEGQRMRRGRNGRGSLSRTSRYFQPARGADGSGHHPVKARGSVAGTGGMACSGYRDPSTRPPRGRGAVTRQRRGAAWPEREGWPIPDTPAFSTRPRRGRGARHPAKARDSVAGTGGVAYPGHPGIFNPPAARTRGASPGKGEGQRGRNGRDGLFRILRSFLSALRCGWERSPPGKGEGRAAARTEREGWPIPDTPAFSARPQRGRERSPPGKGEGRRMRRGRNGRDGLS